VGAVASLVLLIIRELRFPDPILDLRILKIPAFTIAIALQVMMSFTLYGVNLMNPIFLQEFMGYTAWQAGIVLAPRGLGAMAAMLLIGQLERWRIKTRPLMAVGFLLQMASLWYMAHWNLQIGYWEIVWAPIMMSSGFALFFPPLSAATLSCVARERMGYAASLFGVIRNVGAGVGVSVMSTMLVNHQQIHQSYLGEHLSIFDAWRMGATASRMPGSPRFLSLPEQLSGHKEGLAAMYHQFQLQAAMLALNDIYWMLIWFSGTVVPILLVLWLWQSGKAVRPQSDADAAALAH
jgi:DHA2 family multidrug resistance protein